MNILVAFQDLVRCFVSRVGYFVPSSSLKCFWYILSCLILLFTQLAFAAESFRFITDSETENVIRGFISPLLKAANINVNNIHIHIVDDPSINAFVIPGGNIFINTGLIIKFADDPNVLYGVMAHEIAHIYAAHTIIRPREIESASKISVGGTILGLATALAGAPEVGIFLSGASGSAAYGNMMHYSRMHETEADKIAVNLLYKTHNNGEGLIKLFRYLAKREGAIGLDPYMITHPLSMERISSVENSIKEKLGKFGDNITAKDRFEFKRIAIKLDAFIIRPASAIRKYSDNDYGLSIGYFRSGKLDKALELLNKVIAKEPNNSYLQELKGQYYFENGKLELAKECYKQALAKLPKDQIIQLEFAATVINSANNKKQLSSAITMLKQVAIKDPENVMVYFILSRGYGKLGEQDKAILALAEFYFYQGAYGKSEILAKKVIKMSKFGSKEYVRANDILEVSRKSEKYMGK